MRLSIIIPTLNEAGRLRGTCESIRPLLLGLTAEVLLVDGGSRDGTLELALSLPVLMLSAPRGRALQMNAGADVAKGEYLLFLHADTLLTPDASQALIREIAREAPWGRFDVTLTGSQPLLRVVEWSMNTRSRWTGIATGDQALFVRRDLFQRAGGFPAIPLMEDIALSRTLKRHSPPACLFERVLVSSRKWEKEGICRTIGLMWWLRFRYYLGADPARLADEYYGSS